MAFIVLIEIICISKKIKDVGGTLIKPEFFQKRTNFTFPKGNEVEGGFLRIRNEGDKITMTLKIIKANGLIDGQKEIELIIDNSFNLLISTELNFIFSVLMPNWKWLSIMLTIVCLILLSNSIDLSIFTSIFIVKTENRQ